MTDSAPVDGQPTVPMPVPSPPAAPAPPQAAAAVPEAAPGLPVPAVAAEDAPEGPPARLWDRMREDPQYAPEHLALEAVRRLGPEAARWAARARAERPGAPTEELAEQAVRRFVNRARLSGAVSGAAGLPGAVIDVGVLAWTQARMVLHIAAAHGIDPTHPDRATDLLVLQKVHKVAETARLALGVAAGRERAGALFGSGGQAALGKVMLRLGVRLAQMAGVRAAKRIFAKVIPGAAIILGTWANSSATKDLAERSRQLYRSMGPAGGVPRPR
ncbi:MULTISPECIES: EcsC family protein [Micromonospora]|uniref:EcsC protein family protein n=1 Tax=Micromonospora haikouensis TaxID=686309 RepID=A0A0D0V524_9ACTN|nr:MULTISPECIES: EcsC family protein [Micromonospora]KIR66002.1 hypothetical protein TK50_12165 [Micromonospora haikouensis]